MKTKLSLLHCSLRTNLWMGKALINNKPELARRHLDAAKRDIESIRLLYRQNELDKTKSYNMGF